MSQLMLENATADYKLSPKKANVTAKERAEAKAAIERMLKKYGGTLVSSRY